MARCTGAGILVTYTQATDALRGAFESTRSSPILLVTVTAITIQKATKEEILHHKIFR